MTIIMTTFERLKIIKFEGLKNICFKLERIKTNYMSNLRDYKYI